MLVDLFVTNSKQDWQSFFSMYFWVSMRAPGYSGSLYLFSVHSYIRYAYTGIYRVNLSLLKTAMFLSSIPNYDKRSTSCPYNQSHTRINEQVKGTKQFFSINQTSSFSAPSNNVHHTIEQRGTSHEHVLDPCFVFKTYLVR
jgi:hypothetical protein